MKAYLLYKGEEYYSFLKPVLDLLPQKGREFDYVLLSLQASPLNLEFDDLLNRSYEKPIIIKGNQLVDYINEEDCQFIFGAVIAYPKGKVPNLTCKVLDPEIECLEFEKLLVSLFNSKDKPIFVFNPFDSTNTTMLFSDEEIMKKYLKRYPSAIERKFLKDGSLDVPKE